MNKSSQLFSVVLVTLFGLESSVCNAQATITSIDAKAELNRLLAGKAQIHKQRWVEREIGEYYDGSCGKDHADCVKYRRIKKSFLETYTDALRVTEASAEVVGELSVAPQFTLLPDQVHVHTLDIVNCSPDQPQTMTKNLSITVTTTTSIQTSRSITNTKTVTASLKWNFLKIGDAGLTIAGSQSVNLSTSNSQSWSQSVAQSEQVLLTAPARRHSKAVLQVVEGGIEGVFSGVVLLDGPVEPNLDGITMASQILSEAERTFQISGSLRVTSASQSQVIRYDTSINASNKHCPELSDFEKPALQNESLEEVRAGFLQRIELKPAARLAAFQERPRLLSAWPKGIAGNFCYSGPCNEPLDGTRPICYFDEEGACADCQSEPDLVCTPTDPPTETPDEPLVLKDPADPAGSNNSHDPLPPPIKIALSMD